jgi:toxin ParE1/3/4
MRDRLVKRYRVELTADAEADLAAIGDWIAIDNPVRAITFVEEIIAACGTLDLMPDRFAEVDRLGAGVRRMAFGRYLILYRIEADVVAIAPVLHGARDL